MSNNNKQSNGKKQISRVGRSHSSRQNDRTSRNDVDSFADDLPASNSTSILEDATDSDVENDKRIKRKRVEVRHMFEMDNSGGTCKECDMLVSTSQTSDANLRLHLASWNEHGFITLSNETKR